MQGQNGDIFSDFIQSGSLDEWFCDLCTPLRKGHVEYMTLQAAQYHEGHSAEHRRYVAEQEHSMWGSTPADAEAWAAPAKVETPLSKEELKMLESRTHVDMVRDLVPFWIRGVHAAEKGEVLRLEEFLESLHESSESWHGTNGWGGETGHDWANGWATQDDQQVDDGWAAAYDDGAAWGVRDESPNKNPHEQKRRRTGMGRKTQRFKSSAIPHHGQTTAHEFVEDVAKQEAVGEERKRRMHSFFDMPTDDKVKKIDEVIRELLGTVQ
ncbi:hypothetical protein H0H81_005518 [Sphagnurus paluster]|uniref:Uncharacterized protein n=1 Tax=Sphagnurus paluster TaxID=117069 RepID=A0A9P7GLN2_9AGAR|nr:hypothetical protein H0H81_005518 [Sphagnurus paluster]